MSTDSSFARLIVLARGGDDIAAAELVAEYQSHVMRVIRWQLTDRRLRRHLDSLDICQSVLGDFFVRIALGQYQVDTPQQLVALLATIARHKVAKVGAKHRAAKRDMTRMSDVDVHDLGIPGRDPTLSAQMSRRELLAECRRRLTADELQIAEQRANGQGWNDLATDRGCSPDALRMRFQRAIDRVTADLEL